MITEIAIHSVKSVDIDMYPLPDPTPQCCAVRISVSAYGVSGKVEVQTITLYVWNDESQKELSKRIEAFNRAYELIGGVTVDV